MHSAWIPWYHNPWIITNGRDSAARYRLCRSETRKYVTAIAKATRRTSLQFDIEKRSFMLKTPLIRQCHFVMYEAT